MNFVTRYALFFTLACMAFASFALEEDSTCCKSMGGVSYCDSSAGRMVCNNGDYSACYCTRHAVMSLQKLQGCCLWRGGVMETNAMGQVICADGSMSFICTIEVPSDDIAAY